MIMVKQKKLNLNFLTDNSWGSSGIVNFCNRSINFSIQVHSCIPSHGSLHTGAWFSKENGKKVHNFPEGALGHSSCSPCNCITIWKWWVQSSNSNKGNNWTSYQKEVRDVARIGSGPCITGKCNQALHSFKMKILTVVHNFLVHFFCMENSMEMYFSLGCSILTAWVD